MTGAHVRNLVLGGCGVAVLYMILGGLGGVVFPSLVSFRESCGASSALHALTNCDGATLNKIWTWTVGIPRVLLLWPVWTVALLSTFGENFGEHSSAAIFLQIAAAVGLMSAAATTWLGFLFWRQRPLTLMWLTAINLPVL